MSERWGVESVSERWRVESVSERWRVESVSERWGAGACSGARAGSINEAPTSKKGR